MKILVADQIYERILRKMQFAQYCKKKLGRNNSNIFADLEKDQKSMHAHCNLSFWYNFYL